MALVVDLDLVWDMLPILSCISQEVVFLDEGDELDFKLFMFLFRQRCFQHMYRLTRAGSYHLSLYVDLFLTQLLEVARIYKIEREEKFNSYLLVP